jgi:hypothetical protein
VFLPQCVRPSFTRTHILTTGKILFSFRFGHFPCSSYHFPRNVCCFGAPLSYYKFWRIPKPFVCTILCAGIRRILALSAGGSNSLQDTFVAPSTVYSSEVGAHDLLKWSSLFELSSIV